MKTSSAIRLAGGTRQLAAIFGITTQAVYAWGEHMPPLREYQLREKCRMWFVSQSKKAKSVRSPK